MYLYACLATLDPVAFLNYVFTGHSSRHPSRLNRQRPEFIGWFLRWLTRRRRPPANQRYLLRLLRRRPRPPRRLRLRGHQHPAQHALDPKHAPREHPRDPRGPRTRRLHHDTLAHRLAHHPHLRALFTSLGVGPTSRSEAIEPRWARRPLVRHCDGGTVVAGYCGRGARARRVDYARATAERSGGLRGAPEHPPRCYCCAVAQGVRARGGRH